VRTKTGSLALSPKTSGNDAMKVGDKVTVKYHDNIVLRLKAPGEKAVDSSSSALTGTSNARSRDGPWEVCSLFGLEPLHWSGRSR
jgi:hypothetical protein